MTERERDLTPEAQRAMEGETITKFTMSKRDEILELLDTAERTAADIRFKRPFPSAHEKDLAGITAVLIYTVRELLTRGLRIDP